MKKLLLFFGIALLIVPAIALFIQSCTLIGYSIGKKADKASRHPGQGEYVTGWYLSTLDYNPNVTLYLKNGMKISGMYDGLFDDGTETDSTKYIRLVYGNGETSSLFLLSDVEQAFIKNPSTGTHIGTFLGLAADIGVTIAVLPMLKPKPKPRVPIQPSTGGAMTLGCCPYIYSYDGSNYHFDSETFAGALAQAAQRIDWDNLDYLKEYKGMYRFRLANELDEQDFVDELKLVVADHPRGTQVVPSVDGKLYTLAALQSPLRARDLNGADILSRIQPNDEYFWLTNPFGRNPEDDDQLRDGVILEFAQPQGSTSARLVFDVKNTEFSIYVFTQMLSLFGNQLDGFYDQLNQSPETLQSYMEELIREGMLLIHVWNGNDWQPAGFVWEVGPVISKRVVVEIPVLERDADILRLKLECPPGTWMLNSIQADFSNNPPPVVTELSAAKALNHHGEDIRELLVGSDRLYYTMPKQNDYADIEFAAIPRVPNLERSFIVKTEGYYKLNIPAEGDPQAETIRQLRLPGGYSRFALRLLNKDMSAWIAGGRNLK